VTLATVQVERTLEEITADIHDIRQEARRSVLENALRIGQLLLEARPLFQGDEKGYLGWARSEFEYRRRHVFRLMQLAREVPRVALVPADSSIRQALAALIPQTGVFSSDTPEWYTPPEIIECVLELLGTIDLDPCSNEGNPNVPAARCFTVADDGLRQVWSGRVYMNPPYGDVIAEWVAKLRSEYITGNVAEAIALIPARTDTAWWQDNFNASAVCYVRGRLRFSGADNSAPFPSAVAYFGERVDAFVDAFADLGEVRVCV